MTRTMGLSVASNDRLVIEVNRVFHDLEGDDYDGKHDEIFVDEVGRWQAVGRSLLGPTAEGRALLDVGSGTGFVPLQLAPFLGSSDTFVVSDLSPNKLNSCRRRLTRREFDCALEFCHVDGATYSLESGRFDFVTMNSVLHHVPDFAGFFAELDRLLAPGGRIIIGHEPNRGFYKHPFLWNNSRVAWSLLRPGRGAVSLVKLCGLDRVLRCLGIRARLRETYLRLRGRDLQAEVHGQEQLLDKVNQRLLGEGIIDSPLTRAEITTLVDFHSPTAGLKVDPRRGIDIPEMVRVHMPGYQLVDYSTYNHLGEPTYGNRLASLYDEVLSRRYPDSGSSLFAVLRKPSVQAEAPRSGVDPGVSDAGSST